MIIDIIKVTIPLTISFVVGLVVVAPILLVYLYRHKMWKKISGKVDLSGKDTPVFNALHKEKDTNTPRMGGVVIWLSVLFTIGIVWLLAEFFPGPVTSKLNFLSRNQTWLPLFTLVAASIVGLFDDYLTVRGSGLSLRHRIIVVLGLGAVGAWWFYFKLGISTIFIPFFGPGSLGLLFIPLFMLVMLGLFSGGVIDGLDGLSGGVMIGIFAAYTGIAFYQQQIDLATFNAVILGGILAFLWYNVPPARFYMTETGILGLTTTLTVVAFLTDAVIFLPLIALPLVATTASNIIQLSSKKFLGRKVFLSAPMHHHFEALGWPAHQVTMRYWIVGLVCAVLGFVLTILGKLAL